MPGSPYLRRALLAGALVLLAAALRPSAAAAAPWCGTLGADRPALSGGPSVRVLYAVPADGADRSAELAPRIAAEVDEVDAWWRREDSSRTPRFDRYAAPCGPQLDLGVVRLAGATSGTTDVEPLFDVVSAELRGQPFSSDTKYVVYYDGPSTSRICGIGGGFQDGFGVAIVLLGGCTSLGSTAQVAAHELLHAFGLLAAGGPPHACPGDSAHVCDSTGDVLYIYAQPSPLSSFQLDIGRDDYYLHGGSWWDLATSPWLLRLNEQLPLALRLDGLGRVSSDVPGLVCSASCETTWNAGMPLTLTAEPAAGQRFVRWGGGCSGAAETCVFAVEPGRAVTALFAPESYRLTVRVRGRGVVRSEPAGLLATAVRPRTAAFTSFAPVRLVARPAPGWRVRAWGGAARGARARVTVPMTGPTAVRVAFVRR